MPQHSFFASEFRVRRVPAHQCHLPIEEDPVNIAIAEGLLVDTRRRFRKLLMVNPSTVKTKALFRSTAQIQTEETRHLLRHYYMIHPYSRARFHWEVGMVFVYLAQFVLGPLEAAIPRSSAFCLWTKFAADVWCYVDIVLFFFTGYYDGKRQRIQLSARRVARRYLTSYFIVDLVSSLPYNLMCHYAPNSFNYRIKYIYLVKFLRLPTFLRYQQKWCQSLKLWSYNLRTLQLVIVFVVMVWWATVLTHIVLSFSESWRTQHETMTEFLMINFQEVVSLFMLVSGRDFLAFVSGKIFMNVCVLIGSVLGGVVFAQMMQIYNRRSRARNKYNILMQQLTEYMKYKELQPKLRHKIFKYVAFKFQKSVCEESEILDSLSKILQEEILLHNCRTMVERVDFFQELPPPVLLSIVTKLRSEIYLTNDVIVQAGVMGNSMYFLYMGTVAVYASNGVEICHLQDGSHFGEIALVINEPRVASVVAVKECEVFRLSRKDFQEVLEPYPDIRAKIREEAMQRLEGAIRISNIEKQRSVLFADRLSVM